jgi:hypothetical protein
MIMLVTVHRTAFAGRELEHPHADAVVFVDDPGADPAELASITDVNRY